MTMQYTDLKETPNDYQNQNVTDEAIDHAIFESIEEFQERIESKKAEGKDNGKEPLSDNVVDEKSPFHQFFEMDKKVMENLGVKNEKLNETNLVMRELRAKELRENQEKFKDIRSPDWKELYTLFGGPNCYSFAAFGLEKNPFTGEKLGRNPCPGEFAGIEWRERDDQMLKYGGPEAVKEMIEQKWKADCEVLNKELIPVSDKSYIPKDGERLVALLYSEGIWEKGQLIPDFHFMLKGEYGNFLHKEGATAVTNRNNNGDLIFDPGNCATEYEHFLGYYVVKDRKGELI